MKSITLLGILLAVLGIFALVYQGFRYTRWENAVTVDSIQVTRGDTERIPLPPIVGGLALLAATALLVVGARQKT
jgi:hypothetical protein